MATNRRKPSPRPPSLWASDSPAYDRPAYDSPAYESMSLWTPRLLGSGTLGLYGFRALGPVDSVKRISVNIENH